MDLQGWAGVKHQRGQVAAPVSWRWMAEELLDTAKQRELALTHPMTEKTTQAEESFLA